MKYLHAQILSKPGFHLRGCSCDDCLNPNPEPVDVTLIITNYMLSHPSGLKFNRIWRHVQTYPHYTLRQCEDGLNLLVKNGRLGVSNGLFFLRDNPTKRV